MVSSDTGEMIETYEVWCQLYGVDPTSLSMRDRHEISCVRQWLREQQEIELLASWYLSEGIDPAELSIEEREQIAESRQWTVNLWPRIKWAWQRLTKQPLGAEKGRRVKL